MKGKKILTGKREYLLLPWWVLKSVIADHGRDSHHITRWVRQGAESGSVEAQSKMGAWYAKGEGRGLIQNDVQAVYWLTKAAEAEDTVAQRYLGIFHRDGRGGLEDDGQAVSFFEAAARKGDAKSFEALADMRHHGRGCKESRILAYAFASLAAVNDGEGSRKQAELREILSTEDITQAQLLAADWEPGSSLPTEAHIRAAIDNQEPLE